MMKINSEICPNCGGKYEQLYLMFSFSGIFGPYAYSLVVLVFLLGVLFLEPPPDYALAILVAVPIIVGILSQTTFVRCMRCGRTVVISFFERD